jgi:hypothetical protein
MPQVTEIVLSGRQQKTGGFKTRRFSFTDLLFTNSGQQKLTKILLFFPLCYDNAIKHGYNKKIGYAAKHRNIRHLHYGGAE